MPDFDLVVIGAGAAGLSVTAIASALGLKTALIERGEMGGDCLNTGCVPSKALLAVAQRAADARDARRFGIDATPMRIDWATVRAHVRGAIAHIAPNDSEARFRAMGATVIRASAHFTGPNEVAAGTRRYTFRRAVIATGSQAVVPPLPGLHDVPFLTNDTIFGLEDPPGHLIILGGGPIGLEMAQAHARLGCLVTVIEATTIANREDPECVAGLRPALERDGITLIEGMKAAGVAPESGGGVAVMLEDGRRIGGTHLLLALGRAPRLAGLDLQAAGIAHGPRGIQVDRGLRSTSNRRVWAAGDVADVKGLGARAFTHLCSQHAALIARGMMFRLPGKLDYAALPRVTYTDPEIAQIGPTEEEARAAGHTDLTILRWPWSENDRLVAEGRAEGLVKLVVSKRGRLLGASLVGHRAGDQAVALGLMIGRRLPLSALAGLTVPYPTAGEALKRAASEYFTPRLLTPATRRLVGLLKWLP